MVLQEAQHDPGVTVRWMRVCPKRFVSFARRDCVVCQKGLGASDTPPTVDMFSGKEDDIHQKGFTQEEEQTRQSFQEFYF